LILDFLVTDLVRKSKRLKERVAPAVVSVKKVKKSNPEVKEKPTIKKQSAAEAEIQKVAKEVEQAKQQLEKQQLENLRAELLRLKSENQLAQLSQTAKPSIQPSQGTEEKKVTKPRFKWTPSADTSLAYVFLLFHEAGCLLKILL
jgi:predicted ribosome quality control (RQC) complex YloA/Tae2 family protein